MSKLLAKNKKAFFDYEILEKFEAGIKLYGPEVKSIKNSQVNLKGSFVTIHNGKPTATNIHVSPYKPAGLYNGDPTRPRELLLKTKEIAFLQGKLETKGLTCVPLAITLKNNLIKVEIGIVRGKKQYDKRQDIKKKDQKRDMERAVRRYS
jgi:SsrA-binding protein